MLIKFCLLSHSSLAESFFMPYYIIFNLYFYIFDELLYISFLLIHAVQSPYTDIVCTRCWVSVTCLSMSNIEQIQVDIGLFSSCICERSYYIYQLK